MQIKERSVRENRILAITPGTREIGIAVFEDMDLLYYASKDLGKFRQGNTSHSLAREAVRRIEDLIHKYEPQSLLLKEPHPLQCFSPKLVHMTSQIKATGERCKLSLYELAAITARTALCPYERPTRRRATIRLTNLYPELTRYVSNVTLWQRLYYAPMFDAIAVGYLFQQEAERAQRRSEIAEQDDTAASN
jgi:hypothetical protein